MFERNHCFKNKILEVSFSINKNSILFRFLPLKVLIEDNWGHIETYKEYIITI